MKIGFIGMGNMGFALAKGILMNWNKEDMIFSCKTAEKKASASESLGIKGADSNIEVVNASDIVILAVKPQMFDEVFDEIKTAVKDGTILVSLAPGKSIEYLTSVFDGRVRVVRAMPNTPALIGYGCAGVCFDEKLFTAEEISVIEQIFSSVGKYVKVPEDQINTVICASGSSPAYVYMFIDQLIKACLPLGGDELSADDIRKMVASAVVGAGMMVLETGEDPDILKQKVCSKGGTTIAGVNQLEENGFREAISKATEACYNRAVEMSK